MNVNKLELLGSILVEANSLKYQDGKRDGVIKRAIMISKKVFGERSEYVESIRNIKFSPSITWSGMSDDYYLSSFKSGKLQLLNTVKVMIEDYQLSNKEIEQQQSDNKVNSVKTHSNKIFIVHGHNEEMKQSTARFVDRIKYDPIILHEQASQGKTIIEKFTNYSDVSLAIVLLSADDLGVSKNDNLTNAKLRARQNVIFELGFFLGKLGRERVVILHQIVEDFEFPSDYQGVLYIPFDQNGQWKFSLLKEMKILGLDVDANLVI